MNYARPPLCNAVFALLLLVPSTAPADTLQGRVIGVSDGDTITVLDSSREQYKIRLSGIDAPEKAQPFGNRSKQSLSDLAFNRTLSIEYSKRDRYGRLVGKLITPDGRDINLEQIRRGIAWHYKQYEREQSKEDRLTYAQEEEAAREQRKGLWSDPRPVPPWEFRREKREGR